MNLDSMVDRKAGLDRSDMNMLRDGDSVYAIQENFDEEDSMNSISDKRNKSKSSNDLQEPQFKSMIQGFTPRMLEKRKTMDYGQLKRAKFELNDFNSEDSSINQGNISNLNTSGINLSYLNHSKKDQISERKSEIFQRNPHFPQSMIDSNVLKNSRERTKSMNRESKKYILNEDSMIDKLGFSKDVYNQSGKESSKFINLSWMKKSANGSYLDIDRGHEDNRISSNMNYSKKKIGKSFSYLF